MTPEAPLKTLPGRDLRLQAFPGSIETESAASCLRKNALSDAQKYLNPRNAISAAGADMPHPCPSTI